MDKKSKTLLAILLIITVGSVSYTFYKTLVQQDFEVINTEPIEEEGEEASLDEAEATDEEPAVVNGEVATPENLDAKPAEDEK